MPGYEVVGSEELEEIQEIFKNGGGVFFRQGFDSLRNGSYKVKEFEKEFAKFVKAQHSLAVSSGTAALKIALKGLGVQAGDEVITQSFTFVATVEAIIECGAIPKVAEIGSNLNMSPDSLRKLIGPKTRAIIAVHMLGVPCDLDPILDIARLHNIPVIEDTAWGCGGKYKNKFLGAIADIGTYSFDNAKALTTGEGGMIVTNSYELDAKMRAYHDHGHDNNPTVPRWVDTRSSSGFNYRLTELQGAVGLAQLRKLANIISEQQRIHNAISEVLYGIDGISERFVPEGSSPSCDAFVFSVMSNEVAMNCRAKLLEHGLGTKILPEAITWHFAGTWNHMPELVRSHGSDLVAAFIESEKLLRKHVAIPINLSYTPETISKVGKAIREALIPQS